MIQKWMLLGASRGLGREFAELMSEKSSTEICIAARGSVPEKFKHFKMDFAKVGQWDEYLNLIKDFSPNHLVYFAGGGPFGWFHEKKFQDHQWSFRVNFEFPAFLLHQVLRQRAEFSQLTQVCFIGSAVAESKPDPKASSYAAAKHALKGLVSSVQEELKEQSDSLVVSLFSPGYMDTGLLPQNAWPRKEGLARPVNEVARELIAELNS